MQQAETGDVAGAEKGVTRAETVDAKRRQTVQREETGGTERGDMRQDKRGADRGGD